MNVQVPMRPRLDEATSQLLRELCLSRRSSQASLSRKTVLDSATLTAKLLRLERVGILDPRKTKKEVSLRSDLGFVIAVDMGATNLRYQLVNMNGQVLHEERGQVSMHAGPDRTIREIEKQIAKLAARKKLPGKLRAIAVGVPSAVDPRTGNLVNANNLPGWIEVPMRTRLEKRFKVPVSTDNDCNMAAIGEHWKGSARNIRNFIFVAVGTGIGTGLFLDGKIFQGRGGSAGEIYLMNVEWRLWNETFHETGHLESYTSGFGIAGRARKEKLLPKSLQASAPHIDRDTRAVFAAMARGDRKASVLVDDAFTVLGVGIANMISVLDPELIVLNGGLTKGHPQRMIQTIRRVVGRIYSDPPPVQWSDLGEKAQIYGAMWVALELGYANLLHSAG